MDFWKMISFILPRGCNPQVLFFFLQGLHLYDLLFFFTNKIHWTTVIIECIWGETNSFCFSYNATQGWITSLQQTFVTKMITTAKGHYCIFISLWLHGSECCHIGLITFDLACIKSCAFHRFFEKHFTCVVYSTINDILITIKQI